MMNYWKPCWNIKRGKNSWSSLVVWSNVEPKFIIPIFSKTTLIATFWLCLIYDFYEHEHETIKGLIINPNVFQLYYRSCGLMVLMKNYDVYVELVYLCGKRILHYGMCWMQAIVPNESLGRAQQGKPIFLYGHNCMY
jgi:hypothetical protein